MRRRHLSKPCPACGRFCHHWRRIRKFHIRSQFQVEAAMRDHPPFCLACGKPISEGISRCYSCASAGRPPRVPPPAHVAAAPPPAAD